QFARDIATQLALPELMKIAIAKTRELCDADGASLLLVDQATGELYFDTIEGQASGRIERIRLERGQGIAGKVAVTALPRLVEDAQTCPDFDDSIDRKSGFKTGSIVAAPLVVGGDIFGVLMAVRGVGRPAFTPVQLSRLSQLAPHVGIAVHNAQMTTALRATQIEAMTANASLEHKVRERTMQISRAKQEWERTFDALDEPIALMDGFVIRRANEAYGRQVQLSVKELPGRKCHEVLAGRDSPCPGCPLGRGRSAKLSAEVAIPEEHAGRPMVLRFSGYWLSDDMFNESVVVHYQDITEAKSLAERLRESERLAAVGQLASGAAHEINNPLGFVTSNLRSLRSVMEETRDGIHMLSELPQLLSQHKLDGLNQLVDRLGRLEGPDVDDLDDALAMIDESLDGARRVGEIVKGLRELSRLEIGRREPANVNSSVTRAVRSVFGEAPPNVQLSLEADHHADIAPLQLDQALGHVLKNAYQATPSMQKVSIRTWVEGNEVLLQVRDDGLGIVRENLRRVFEPFFTTRGVGKGIGLGLTAAYGIVKGSAGDIEVDSAGPGQGAVVTIRLPRADQRVPTSPLVSASEAVAVA
ncbi:MAG: GAF domain-containing protein, partial [Archangium sp.]|nr:GAF domain-containing protein [Archangium sp.]